MTWRIVLIDHYINTVDIVSIQISTLTQHRDRYTSAGQEFCVTNAKVAVDEADNNSNNIA